MNRRIRYSSDAVALDASILEAMVKDGYKYVQIKGLDSDKRYDYLAPRFVLLVPLKELPVDPREKDIYEPIPSPLLEQWANELDDHFKVIVAYPS